MLSLRLGIAAKHRPRVVYFFADWCGACKQYTPVLKNAVADFEKSVDFQLVNVDDPNYTKLKAQYHIRSIPATFIFDRDGLPVFSMGGCVDRASLDHALLNVCNPVIDESKSAYLQTNRLQASQTNQAGSNR